MMDRRFIEETFPVKEVSAESAREKNIRHGHISTLHIWWARRPLAASRATTYAALVPAPEDSLERERRRQFIAELCKWENSLDPHLLERARRDILEAHAKRLSDERGETVTVADIEAGSAPLPRVLDPFAGGGAIPLEALRLGCEVHASDYNPVAVLILKATLEYPQKYGRPFERMPEQLLGMAGHKRSKSKGDEDEQLALGMREGDKETFEIDPNFNPLLAAVKYWGDRVVEEARVELAEFYPAESDDTIPVGYVWAHTMACSNPVCGAEIPLVRQFWLVNKKKKKVALFPVEEDGHLSFRIVAKGQKAVGYEEWPEGFDASKGTISRAVATCRVCGATTKAQTTRRNFQEGKTGRRLLAVILTREKQTGKIYRLAKDIDVIAAGSAGESLAVKREALLTEWGMDPVPNEDFPSAVRMITEPLGSAQNYGFATWGDLFSSRQKLALLTLGEKVRNAYREMVKTFDEGFARAVVTCLALALSKFATTSNLLTRWNSSSESFASCPDQSGSLSMKFDWPESNPFSGITGSYENTLKSLLQVTVNKIPAGAYVQVAQTSATSLEYRGDGFDAVLTDPPYYDNFAYSYLSDFFYVWLKRVIGHLYPDLFSTPLTPKSDEIVAYMPSEGGVEAGERAFEQMLKEAFQEIFRVLKPEGSAVIVYAHKSTAGWEAVINALLESGLVVTGAWPLHTERKARLMAQETASLASSIYIVTRKRESEPTGFYNEVRDELQQYLQNRLEGLWAEGIGGADFFIAAIGSAIEVFGRYEKVIDYEGSVVRADRLLEDVRTLATDFAVRRILRDGFVQEVSELTRFYVLWRWNFGEARVPFDDARKLAQSCGLDLTEEWDRRGGFVRKQKEYVRVLGPGERDLKQLAESHELINTLHLGLRLWEKGQRAEMIEALAVSGFGGREVFYRVVQAVAESLPKESKEKRLLEGFMAGRERVQAEVDEALQQGKLFD